MKRKLSKRSFKNRLYRLNENSSLKQPTVGTKPGPESLLDHMSKMENGIDNKLDELSNRLDTLIGLVQK